LSKNAALNALAIVPARLSKRAASSLCPRARAIAAIVVVVLWM
jgi:hypothetical protein